MPLKDHEVEWTPGVDAETDIIYEGDPPSAKCRLCGEYIEIGSPCTKIQLFDDPFVLKGENVFFHGNRMKYSYQIEIGVSCYRIINNFLVYPGYETEIKKDRVYQCDGCRKYFTSDCMTVIYKSRTTEIKICASCDPSMDEAGYRESMASWKNEQAKAAD